MKLNKCRLGDIITQRREKYNGEDIPICGVTREGFIPPKQKDADTSLYNVFRLKDFVFNPARMELNSIVFNDMYTKATCSSLYEVFYVNNPDMVLPEYLALLVKQDWFTRYCEFLGSGSAREYCRVANISEIEIEYPSIDTQRQIVNEYAVLKERIRIKKQINDNLAAQVNALYKKSTQGKEANAVFSDIAIVESGKRPISSVSGIYPLIGAGGIMNYIDDFNYDEQILVTGRVGTHGVIQRLFSKCWASDNTLVIKSNHYEFSYHFLKSVDWDLLNRGSTQPLVTQTDIKNLPIYIPSVDELSSFEATAQNIMLHQKDCLVEIEKLQQLKEVIISSISNN